MRLTTQRKLSALSAVDLAPKQGKEILQTEKGLRVVVQHLEGEALGIPAAEGASLHHRVEGLGQ